jgi:hypothetical protein
MTHGGDDAQGGAGEGGRQLGDQFLETVGLGPKAPRLVTVQARGMARPVRQLMQGGAVVVDLLAEGRLRRDADIVESRGVIGLVAADPEIGAGRGDQGLDVRDDLTLGQGRGRRRQGLQAFALIDVEDGEALEERHRAGRLALARGPLLLGLGRELVGEDDGGPPLAPANLPACLLGLAVGQPALGFIAMLDDRAPQQQDVDPRIAAPGRGVAR